MKTEYEQQLEREVENLKFKLSVNDQMTKSFACSCAVAFVVVLALARWAVVNAEFSCRSREDVTPLYAPLQENF